MPSRIVTLQRQARELGRLRAGLTASTVKNGRTITYPTSSKTWILTSSQRDYLDAAAELWSGTVEEWEPQGGGPKAWRLITERPEIDAILPPGDPLSQAFELWSRGGCQRRCDGERELRSDQPCLCEAQFGKDFHERPQGEVCDIHTRLNVILPDLPDIGVWRVETKGYWAANRIAACVDLIKAQVGANILIPVRLRIDPKKKVKDGKTSNFTEIVVEIRGGITFGQVLAGQVPNLAVTAAERTAIEAGAASDEAAPAAQPQPVPGREQPLTVDRALKDIASARNQKQLDALKGDFRAAGLRDQSVVDAWLARAVELGETKPTSAPPAPPVEVDADADEPDKAALWFQILAVAGAAPHRWSADELEKRINARFDKASDEINGWQTQTFLDELKSGAIQ